MILAASVYIFFSLSTEAPHGASGKQEAQRKLVEKMEAWRTHHAAMPGITDSEILASTLTRYTILPNTQGESPTASSYSFGVRCVFMHPDGKQTEETITVTLSGSKEQIWNIFRK